MNNVASDLPQQIAYFFALECLKIIVNHFGRYSREIFGNGGK
jgi:hypothetical protein